MKRKIIHILILLISLPFFLSGCGWFRDQFVMDYDVVQKALTSLLSEDIYSFTCTFTASCQSELSIDPEEDVKPCEMDDIIMTFQGTADRANQTIMIESVETGNIWYLKVTDMRVDLYLPNEIGYMLTTYEAPQMSEAMRAIFFTEDRDFLGGEGAGFYENEIRMDMTYSSDRTTDAAIFYLPSELIAGKTATSKPPLTIMIYLDESGKNDRILIDTINYFDSGLTELIEYSYEAYTNQPLQNAFTRSDTDYFFSCSIELTTDETTMPIVLPDTK